MYYLETKWGNLLVPKNPRNPKKDLSWMGSVSLISLFLGKQPFLTKTKIKARKNRIHIRHPFRRSWIQLNLARSQIKLRQRRQKKLIQLQIILLSMDLLKLSRARSLFKKSILTTTLKILKPS